MDIEKTINQLRVLYIKQDSLINKIKEVLKDTMNVLRINDLMSTDYYNEEIKHLIGIHDCWDTCEHNVKNMKFHNLDELIPKMENKEVKTQHVKRTFKF